MSHTVRRLLIILAVVLALISIAGIVFVRVWLDPLVKEKLVALTAESSHEMYALKIDQLHINILTGSVNAGGIQLNTDTTRWEQMHQEKPDETPLKIDLQITRLRIKNISWIRYWRTKNLDLRGIQIVNPQIDLVSIQDTAQEKVPQVDTPAQHILERLPLLIAPFANHVHIGYVAITNGKISMQNLLRNKSSYQQADSINGVLSHFNIAARDTTENTTALYCKHILLSIRNFEWYPAGTVYGYRVKSVAIDGQDEAIKLEDITVHPKISDAEFMQRLTFRIPRVKVKMKEILIRKFDLFRALHKQEWMMETVTVESARINVYQNKNLPLPRKQMPNEMFRNLKPYLNIDTILIRNSNILYTELLEDDKGQLEFEHTNGVILNITNDTLKMSDKTPASINARAELMGAGLLDLSLDIPLLSKTFDCDVAAHLGEIDMTYLNRLVEDKNNFRVESGKSEKIVMKAQVRNGLAQGKIEATYDDLKISVLREKDGSKKKLVSAVANIILRGKNERGSPDQPFKVGTIYYRREPTDGILRYIWRSAQTGLIETLVPSNISKGKMPG
ncbi:MAG: hypothetical protein H7246_16255 [Phycisphaerae bacterium]|nr:hypothetical protein [Saprospiraceae bacterium]